MVAGLIRAALDQHSWEQKAQKQQTPPRAGLHIRRTGKTRGLDNHEFPKITGLRQAETTFLLLRALVCRFSAHSWAGCAANPNGKLMPRINSLPNHLRPKREKVFGDGRPVPLDRNAKVRVFTLARALMRRTEAGRHYGPLTAKAVAVLEALLWRFHNARSGLCFPSYEKIAEAAGCARSTVAEAIKALEATGLLSWVNRLVRIRVAERDIFGKLASRWRLIRTSNGYRFRDPGAGFSAAATAPKNHASSKSDLRSGTMNQEFITLSSAKKVPRYDADSPLEKALAKLGEHFKPVNGVKA
jgi:hypothetical protein